MAYLYKRMKKQYSYDNGITWIDSNPPEYIVGELIDANSDCNPIQYRWIDVEYNENDSNTYLCDSGHNLYSVEKKQFSSDEGLTWNDVIPLELRPKSLMYMDWYLCGGTQYPPIYQWVQIELDETNPETYMCSGVNTYYKEKLQVSTDNGITWKDESPLVTQMGSLYKEDWYLCGGTQYPPIYRWNEIEFNKDDTSTYICDGVDLYLIEIYQVSTDNGKTWEDVEPKQTRKGNLLIENIDLCGGYYEITDDMFIDFEFKRNSTGNCQLGFECLVKQQEYSVISDGSYSNNNYNWKTVSNKEKNYTVLEIPYSLGRYRIDLRKFLGINRIKLYYDNNYKFSYVSVSGRNIESNDTEKLNLTKIYRIFDCTNFSNMSYMFGIPTLDYISEEAWNNIRKVKLITNFSSTFKSCLLVELPLTNLNFGNGSNICYLNESFYGCTNLKKIDFSNSIFNMCDFSDLFNQTVTSLEEIYFDNIQMENCSGYGRFSTPNPITIYARNVSSNTLNEIQQIIPNNSNLITE